MKVTIGELVAAALSLAAEAALKATVGEAVKDAYKALKEKVARWAGGDVGALEKAPAYVIAEAVDGQPAGERAMVKALVAELVAALKSEAKKTAGGGPVELDIGKLDALEVKLGAITVTEGTGVIDVFRTGPINVGPSPGKSGR